MYVCDFLDILQLQSQILLKLYFRILYVGIPKQVCVDVILMGNDEVTIATNKLSFYTNCFIIGVVSK